MRGTRGRDSRACSVYFLISCVCVHVTRHKVMRDVTEASSFCIDSRASPAAGGGHVTEHSACQLPAGVQDAGSAAPFSFFTTPKKLLPPPAPSTSVKSVDRTEQGDAAALEMAMQSPLAASVGAQQAAAGRQDTDDDCSRLGQPQHDVQGQESRETDGPGAQPSVRRGEPVPGAAQVRGDERAAAASCAVCHSGHEVAEVAEQEQADPAAVERGGRGRGAMGEGPVLRAEDG